MIESLEAIDRWLVLAVNQWNTPFLDQFFWIVAGKFIWIPIYLLLAYLAYRKMELRNFLIFLFCTILAVALADLISVHLFKNVFQRYRPSHHLLLTEKLHFYKISDKDFYKGGEYGFVSSHATNFFALATFVGLALKKLYPKLMLILTLLAVLVSFSRMYQGVHYLSDLLGGAILGLSVSLLIYHFLYKKIKER